VCSCCCRCVMCECGYWSKMRVRVNFFCCCEAVHCGFSLLQVRVCECEFECACNMRHEQKQQQ
jgi:hypothetical protein